MKQRPRQTNGTLWLPRAIPGDIKEMDANYQRVSPDKLQWIDDNYIASEEEKEVEAPGMVEEETVAVEEEPLDSATADELLTEEDDA